jgi:proline-specific peptidase
MLGIIMTEHAHLVNIGDTRLYVVERGQGFPIIVLHGGPGLDHHEFGDYLDSLCSSQTGHESQPGAQYRLILVDERAQGQSDPAPLESLSLEIMARDVSSLANALNLESYAVLGHSYGAFIALQHAVDYPGAAAGTIISNGLPSAKYLERVAENLANFEPLELRAQVTDSWAREKTAHTQADVSSIMNDQWAFQFGNPTDSRILEYIQRTQGSVFAPDVLRHFANQEYGGIEVEARLSEVTQPVLIIGGRLDRTCVVEGSEAMATGIPNSSLVVLENSGHMTFVEEPETYLAAVRGFLDGLKR